MSNGPQDIQVLRLGIKYDPPTLAIEYKVKEKLFHKSLKLKRLKPDSVTSKKKESLMNKLIDHNSLILNKVPKEQILRLLDKLYDINTQNANTTNTTTTTTTTATNTDSPKKQEQEKPFIEKERYSNNDDVLDKYATINLNKESDEVIFRAKKDMNVLFEANVVRPDADDYRWDVRKEFEAVEDNDWDDSEESD